jgi:DNA-binding response OmpR family regulator
VEIVQNGSLALERLNKFDPDLVIINVSTFHSSGKRICENIRAKNSNLPIVIITKPGKPVSTDRQVNVVLTLPFTYRKLHNRIAPLLPGDTGHMLHIGPIRLDTGRNWVRCEGREAKLTPRQTQVLKALMHHPGEVMEREQLFSQVWETGYTGDTRTLDVHISWLRQAIEEDPHNPVLLKTIRGVGYRLDI